MRELDHDADMLAVSQVLRGDTEAFRGLYHRHYNRVLAVVRGVVLNSTDAEDVTQEVFATVYRKLKQFDRKSLFSTWLYRVAMNRAIQFARTRTWERKAVSLEVVEGRAAKQDESNGTDPQIEAAMATLEPDDRAILVLFYWQELSLIEIGNAMECSPNAAKTRLFRAREKFKNAYQEVLNAAHSA